MKPKIAIIGSGISGIACAYYLSKDFDITLFEKENYLGGHTNTIEILRDNKIIPVDTGFIVFNLHTYPNLLNFFNELEVEFIESNMSFSVWNQNKSLYYAGTNINTIFAQRKNFFNIRFYKLLKEILRFNKFIHIYYNKEISYSISINDFLKEYKFDNFFSENYLIPMCSAIWSTDPQKILDFPLKTLVHFFKNHGLASVNGHYQWYTVKNGSYNYIKKVLKKSSFKYYLNEPVLEVIRNKEKNNITILTKNRKQEFDFAIIATHSPTALKILKDATKKEKEILSKFHYQKNIAILHEDNNIMCYDKKIWSSWNYKIGKDFKTSTTYYMKKLQPWIDFDLFVSINEYENINNKKIYKIIEYEHPVFDTEAIKYQDRLYELNNNGLVYFCGAYFRYGFHEDGILSSLEVVNKIKNNVFIEKSRYEFPNIRNNHYT
ncbi:MAG: FAD-dependent oxidoreductase [Leptospiraceae bacterium]|nr:FAD-dependent oxidoreductase [Leptospiraceae bacterium]